jgi:hypothetical protein
MYLIFDVHIIGILKKASGYVIDRNQFLRFIA